MARKRKKGRKPNFSSPKRVEAKDLRLPLGQPVTYWYGKMGAFATDGSGQSLAGERGNNGLLPRSVGLRPGVTPKLEFLNEPRKPRVITLEDDEPVSEEKTVPRKSGR